MDDRRIIGLDLGIASAHTAIVLDADGSQVCRRRCSPTVQSLGALEAAALDGAPEGTRLQVVIEPTGPAWLPVAVFFGRRGHVVCRVASAKAADLRRFFSRHAKSNAIDAMTLARLAFVDPDGLRPVELPGAERASLDRRVRACDRLTRAAATHKRRIKDLARSLLPMSPLAGDITRADLAVLERWADPNALVRAGRAQVGSVIARASNNHQGPERAERWLAAAHASVALYGGDTAVAFGDLAAEVATEIRLLRAVEAELRCTPRPARVSMRRSIPKGSRGPCPASQRSAARSCRRRSVERTGSRAAHRSEASPGSPRRRQRPVRPIARPSRCRRRDRRCFARSCSVRRTWPARSIRSSPRSTTGRWWNAGRIT